VLLKKQEGVFTFLLLFFLFEPVFSLRRGLFPALEKNLLRFPLLRFPKTFVLGIEALFAPTGKISLHVSSLFSS